MDSYDSFGLYNYDNIPDYLKQRNQWVCTLNKVPMQPNGRKAASTRPRTWSTLDDCREAVEYGPYDGIGFAFHRSDKLAGIDLDKCIDADGVLEPWAREIVNKFRGTYIEYSPSGTGLHIWCYGEHRRNGKGVEQKKLECYDSGRYFTVTGFLFEDAKPILINKIYALEWLNYTFMRDKPQPEAVQTSPPRLAQVKESNTDERVEWALKILSTSSALTEHDEWLKVGMSLHAGGYPVSVWDEWSRLAPNYVPGECQKRWKSFGGRAKGFKIGSLIWMAKQARIAS